MATTTRSGALRLDPARVEPLHCSMCGRDEHQVRYLMAGAAGGHLCDDCTVAAVKIVLRQRARDLVRRSAARA
jgi:hypothetical protein